jgi:phosphate transport system permease protein
MTDQPDSDAATTELPEPVGELPDHARPLTASGNLRRRNVVSRVTETVATGAALLAVAVLGIVVWSVASRGASALSLDFLTKDPAPFGSPGGGIGPAIVGTGVIVAIATAMAMPVGILVALYLTEFADRRTARVIRLALDLLNGLPSIVIGLFVFGLIVVAQHHQSGFAGSFALAIIMLPLIARASQEVLLLVPHNLREAADALGVSHWRAVRGVVLPSALGGILTGTVLAVARAAGETAPLVLLSSIYPVQLSLDLFGHGGHGMNNIPLTIFNASEAPDPGAQARGWGAALVLLGFILVASIGARMLLARTRAKLTR